MQLSCKEVGGCLRGVWGECLVGVCLRGGCLVGGCLWGGCLVGVR